MGPAPPGYVPAQRALAARPEDSTRTAVRVDLPWGRAVKATWTRNRTAANLHNVKHVVGYWVVAEHLETSVTVDGDVSTDIDADLGPTLSAIDAIAESVQLSLG